VRPGAGKNPCLYADDQTREQVWRTIKREVAATFIADREHLMATITEAFKKEAAKSSYRAK
jgi:hypothetical protein